MSLDLIFRSTTASTAQQLASALSGADLSAEAITALFDAPASDFPALVATADRLRLEQVGDIVTYVVNRNINFTNVCVKRCGFCAFSRTSRDNEGYFLPVEEVVRRAIEARDLGATEICIQAGLPPGLEPGFYVGLCKAVKTAVPGLHIHAFSPEEVLYGCRQAGWSVLDHLSRLQDAGLGSLPGTSAEILDDELRDTISPGRITTAQWVDIVRTAHQLGIPTTSTMMYGHLETSSHRARHLVLLRDLQAETGGFTEFVPLSFVHYEAPMFMDARFPRINGGTSGLDVVKTHAIARIALGRTIQNIQTSWVKDGLKISQLCLSAGANDLGGTLINESISTAAGSEFGQRLAPRELRDCIRGAARIPCERATTYQRLRLFTEEPAEREPLDSISEGDTDRLGSYQALAQSKSFRFRPELAGSG